MIPPESVQIILIIGMACGIFTRTYMKFQQKQKEDTESGLPPRKFDAKYLTGAVFTGIIILFTSFMFSEAVALEVDSNASIMTVLGIGFFAAFGTTSKLNEVINELIEKLVESIHKS